MMRSFPVWCLKLDTGYVSLDSNLIRKARASRKLSLGL
jgi:hypothetical protein